MKWMFPCVVAIALAGAFAGCATRPTATREPDTTAAVTEVLQQTAIDKIDLVFAIDNSGSMADKQALLAEAVPDLIARLVTPACVDAADEATVVGKSDAAGKCPAGSKPEFKAIHDVHVAVVSSSLGGRGSDSCMPAAGYDMDDRGELVDRRAAPSSTRFLAWAPGVEAELTEVVSAVGEHGCGYEGQLESVYRFLVQPDPYARIVRDAPGSPVRLEGVDDALLAQRRAFLRPDSLVAIVMLTDENESTVDPMAFGGRAYWFEQPVDDTHAHVYGGTTACASDPNGPACRSCYLKDAADDPACKAPLAAADDPVNVRFFHPKQRFGVDPRFPVERYVRGFSQPQVPDRFTEHPDGASTYAGEPKCTNPLFAAALPEGRPGEELCKLARGPRAPDLVYFALIGGVPWQLLTTEPADMSAANHAPFKAALDDGDWSRLVGKDPLRYDFTGIDPHMLESISPRGVPADDAHSREWDTKGADLQYACTFPLPAPRTCAAGDVTCDCDGASDAPLCDPASPRTQVRGKAYPTVNQLLVAKGLGEHAIVASLCAREVADKTSADYGYRPAVRAIVERLKKRLTNQCLPQRLPRDPGTGEVPCLVLVESPKLAGQAACEDPGKGLRDPTRDPALAGAVRRFRERQGIAEGAPLCESVQIAPADLGGRACDDELAPAGWCYLDGTAAKGCAQKIQFSPAGTPLGTVHLECMETLSEP